jgi:short-subunit dehydrogenase|tara:strand:+ start:503 stop:1231 length:729 start_codon:yes stop_codon:yes gene_type:complete
MNFEGKKYWLVGASEGLGRALALRMSQAGAELILSARNSQRLVELSADLPGPSQVLAMDISDTDSVARAGGELRDIDGVVFLAGVYWPMPAKDWNGADALAMANINFTGAFRVLDQVMEQFLSVDKGHIVITGSLSGFRGLPRSIGYSASKAGVMALAESLYADLRTTGIRVQIANPGFIKTRLTEKNSFNMPFIMSADEAADHMMRHMRSTRFKYSFPTLFSWLFRSSQFLPDWLYYRIFS